MGFITRVILIAVIVILVLTFVPKHNGSVICFGCEDRACDCFGFERDKGGEDICIGVPHNCEELPETPPTG